MSEQKYLNVEMRVMFNVPVDELSEEELEELACDYFFESGGIYKADYCDFEFDI